MKKEFEYKGLSITQYRKYYAHITNLLSNDQIEKYKPIITKDFTTEDITILNNCLHVDSEQKSSLVKVDKVHNIYCCKICKKAFYTMNIDYDIKPEDLVSERDIQCTVETLKMLASVLDKEVQESIKYLFNYDYYTSSERIEELCKTFEDTKKKFTEKVTSGVYSIEYVDLVKKLRKLY